MARRTADELWICSIDDTIPGMACCVDFGINPPDECRKFGALQFAIKRGLVSKAELYDATGNGPELTKIVNRGGNPYAREIHTAWDGLEDEDEVYEDEAFDDESAPF